MTCPCRSAREKFGEEEVLSFDCKESLSNATLSNKECREHVLAEIKDRLPDIIVLKKNFNRVYDKETLKKMIDLVDVERSIEAKLNSVMSGICDKCRPFAEKLDRNRGNISTLFYLAEDPKLCINCHRANDAKLKEISKIIRNSQFYRKILDSEKPSEFYNNILKCKLVPSLINSHIMTAAPSQKQIESYKVGDVKITLYELSHRPDNYYFVTYPEFELSNDDLKAVQNVFEKIVKTDISRTSHMEIRNEINQAINELLKGNKNKQRLANILTRHTIGYGIIEPLLQDEELQDIYVDSGSKLVHVVHSKFGECITNIFMSKEDIDRLSTRIRTLSGRPFDASSPVLHTELGDLGVRIAAIAEPATYSGIGFAFRRRKNEPWTLPEFIKFNMLNAEAAGLLSFLLDGNSSILIVGPRGSGKTSMLTSLLLEINQNNRIIIIEDTPEVPIDQLRTMGYKIEHLRTEAFAKGYELSAEDALRTSLRLGESILVLGEVRGQEAKTLFEAMRVGAVGNVVLGTIHGSSPYDVWDRITNDLGVPSTSFKATDIIVTTGVIREGDAIKRNRRVLDITEVRKDWKDEPKFYTLMKYDRRRDKLVMGDLSRSEAIKKAAKTKGYTIGEVKKNIKYRIKLKKELLRMAKKNPKLLGANSIISANSIFTKAMSQKGKSGEKRFAEAMKSIRNRS